MNNQESMFDTPEHTVYRARPYNEGSREQYEEASEEGYEGYSERPRPYIDGGMHQIGDGKIRPQRPRSNRTNWLIALAVGIPLILFIALGGIGFAFGRGDKMGSWNNDQRGWHGPPFGWNKRMHGREPMTIKVGVQPTLIINNPGGAVHIHAGDAGRVVVQPQGFNDSRGGFGGVQPTYDLQDNTVTIDAQNQPGSGPGSPFNSDNADLEITAPSTSNIQIQTDSGDVEIDGIDGQFNITTGRGDVNVQGVQLHGQSSLKTSNGDISFNGAIDAQGNYQFVTGSGDVDLSLPGNSSFTLNTTTSSGDVSNDFNETTIGPGPHPQLSINTGSGSIRLQKEQ
jgi:Toastrack DUF4097